MRFLVQLIFLFILGCGSLPSFKKSSKLGSINGSGKFSEISSDLKRATMSGIAVQRVGYFATSLPYTDSYLSSEAREQCVKNLESKDVCDQKINEKLALYKDRSCFYLELETMTIDLAKEELWKVKIEQPIGKFNEGKIIGFSKIPALSVGSARPWSNSGTVCFTPKIDFLNEFRMIIIPQLGGSDYGPLELVWLKPKEK
jgi:hypothetical protein